MAPLSHFRMDDLTYLSSEYLHVLACMDESRLAPPVLGVVWNGVTGGGEFLCVDASTYQRVAHLREFPLPDGAQSICEPRHAAMGLLWALYGEAAFEMVEPLRAFTAWERASLREKLEAVPMGVEARYTTSAARLFDAVAALLDLCQHATCEGRGIQELDFAVHGILTNERYTFYYRGDTLDWRGAISGILADLAADLPLGLIAARFMNTLVEMIVAVAREVNTPAVLLMGECFHSHYLLDRAIHRLREEDFEPYWSRNLGVGGGLAHPVGAAW